MNSNNYPHAITFHAKYQSLSKLLLPSSYNTIVFTSLLFTSLTKTASYLTLIILEISLLLSEGLLSRYTLLLSQLDVQSHPMQSVGDL